MTSDDLSYSGLEILRGLAAAKRYNALLVDIILENVTGRKSLVDFGAGIGTFAKLLRARGYRILCVEPDPFLRKEIGQADFDTADGIYSLPDQSAEFIFSLNVFEHIPDDAAVLCALRGKLRDGGRLLIYVPAFELLWSSLDDQVKHYRRYTRTSLMQLVVGCGYRVRKCRYADSLGFVAALAFRLMGNKHGNLSPSSIRLYDKFILPLSRRCDFILQYAFGKNVYVVCDKSTG